MLLAVAPYAGIGHGTHEFLKELIRLADISPGAVAAVVGALIKTYRRTYDYEGAMKSLIAKLAERGQRQLALQYCEQLREVDGIPELFIKLRDGGR